MARLSLFLVFALAMPSADYRAEIESFRTQRAASIGAETGWAALTDLVWLDKPGELTIGRAATNAIVLHAPSAPPRLGTLAVTAQAVTLRLAPGVDARVHGRAVQTVELVPDTDAPDALTTGGVTIALIDREHRRALRVWDRLSPTRQSFHGLRWYAIAERWRVEATFVAHAHAPTLKIQNIVGQVVAMANPGTAVFTIGGQEYRLEALLESSTDSELFFMFRDGTSGKTTYGAGRYLYAPMPHAGRVTLDFNRAMNPPCAFTAFATCPLPPKSNRLTVAIEAGELDHQH